MKKNARKPQTIAERMTDAYEALDSAVNMFEDAAVRLDAAQAAHEEIAAEARAEIARLSVVVDNSTVAAQHAERVASKVRDLIA